MTLFEFMGAHPWLTFFLAMIAMCTIVGAAEGLGPKRCKCKCRA